MKITFHLIFHFPLQATDFGFQQQASSTNISTVDGRVGERLSDCPTANRVALFLVFCRC